MDQNSQARPTFEWLCYGFLRDYRPAWVVVLESGKGRMLEWAVRAVRDNASGKVFCIDPSPGVESFGEGKASARLGQTAGVLYFSMAVEEALLQIRKRIRTQPGVVIIDGLDNPVQAIPDFDLFTSLLTEGFVLLYGSNFPPSGWSQTLQTLRNQGYPIITLPQGAGLSIIQVGKRSDSFPVWDYLSQE